MQNFSSMHVSEEKGDVMISRDLQISMMIGAFARVYWSCSPPAVRSLRTSFQGLIEVQVFIEGELKTNLMVFDIPKLILKDDLAW